MGCSEISLSLANLIFHFLSLQYVVIPVRKNVLFAQFAVQ